MSKKTDSIKFMGINTYDKTELIFEGKSWFITFDRYHFQGTIESNKTLYNFYYNKGYGNVDIISGTMEKGNVKKYSEPHIPLFIPKYIIEKIKEIAHTIIHNSEYFINLDNKIQKTKKKCYETNQDLTK